jgi:hypothetical protein
VRRKSMVFEGLDIQAERSDEGQIVVVAAPHRPINFDEIITACIADGLGMRCEFFDVVVHIDDVEEFEYVNGDCRIQLAKKVAAQLRNHGFTIVGQDVAYEKLHGHPVLDFGGWCG